MSHPAYPVAMRHASFLALATTVAIALLAASAPVASGAGPEQGTVVLVDLDLKASNGLHAHLGNSEDGTVTLELRRKGQVVPTTKCLAKPPKRG